MIGQADVILAIEMNDLWGTFKNAPGQLLGGGARDLRHNFINVAHDQGVNEILCPATCRARVDRRPCQLHDPACYQRRPRSPGRASRYLAPHR